MYLSLNDVIKMCVNYEVVSQCVPHGNFPKGVVVGFHYLI